MGVVQKLRVYGYIVIVFFFTIACGPVSSPYHGLINHPECSSPCWIGIEIGKTSFDRAQELLAEKYGSRNLDSYYGKTIEWKTRLNSGHISFHQDKAMDMFVFFDDDADLTVDRLIDALGEPEWIFVNSQPTIHCEHYRLDYPSIGIDGDLEMFKVNERIQASSKVIMLRFQKKTMIEDLYVYDGYLVKWDGYKNYCNQQ